MPNNAREPRDKPKRGTKSAAAPTLTVVPTSKPADDQPPQNAVPTLTVPASWTPDFCLDMAKLSREDQNPLPPHIWTLRAHTIAFAGEHKKKHPFLGMPVNEHGGELPLPPTAIPRDFKSQLLGALGDRVTMKEFAPPSD